MKDRLRRIAAALAGALFLTAAPGAAADNAPLRVVSINLCTDQLAVLLLPRERIAALSFLAADRDLSHVAGRIDGIPMVQGLAEEVLALKPDLVLAGTYTTRPTVAILKARGIPVWDLGLASDFDDIRRQTRALAAVLGVPERGEALLAEMDAKLTAAAAPVGAGPGARTAGPTALTFAPGGFTAGGGTLSDAVLQAAGLRNHAAELGLTGYGYLPVEAVAARPPDLLISDTESKRYPSLQHVMLSHPALSRAVLADRRPDLPGTLWACGGPFTADAVTALAEARRRFEGTGPMLAAVGPEATP